MATPVNSGYASEIFNVSISAAGFVPVTFTKIPNNVLISSRGKIDMQVALDAAGTTYFTIPAGTSLTYDWNMGTKTNTLFLKSTGSDTAEIIATYEG
jgi:hypothetical protein